MSTYSNTIVYVARMQRNCLRHKIVLQLSTSQ